MYSLYKKRVQEADAVTAAVLERKFNPPAEEVRAALQLCAWV